MTLLSEVNRAIEWARDETQRPNAAPQIFLYDVYNDAFRPAKPEDFADPGTRFVYDTTLNRYVPARDVKEKRALVRAGEDPPKRAPELVRERKETHGDFLKTALVAGMIKAAYRNGGSYKSATHVQRESMDMIAMKLARIACGDANFEDHWRDIAGYVALAMMEEVASD
jgi:hypothetical protein